MPAHQADRSDAVHAEAIATLAKDTHHPLPVVRRIYEVEYARLKAEAKVTDYLVLFACRRTRDALTHGQA